MLFFAETLLLLSIKNNAEKAWEVWYPSIVSALTQSLGSNNIHLLSRSAHVATTSLMLLKITKS